MISRTLSSWTMANLVLDRALASVMPRRIITATDSANRREGQWNFLGLYQRRTQQTYDSFSMRFRLIFNDLCPVRCRSATVQGYLSTFSHMTRLATFGT